MPFTPKSQDVIRAGLARAQPDLLFPFLVLAIFVLFTALLGIASRPLGQLAACWPANALLLGVMVRYPRLAAPAGWVGAFAGFVVADMITGGTFLRTLVLTSGNLVGVAAGYALYCRLDEDDKRLMNPLSIPYFIGIVFIAAAASGFVGAFAYPMFFSGDALSGWLYWFSSEFASYVAFLPVVLTMPALSEPRRQADRFSFAPPDLQLSLPLAALVASCVAGWFIGGPGAVAFPIPALLWCALSYGVFATSVFTLLFGVWALITASFGDFALSPADMNSMAFLLSYRVGIAMIALCPLTVASVMAARNRLIEHFRHVAASDALSGLPNRRSFFEQTEPLLRRLTERKRPCALLMIDIDHFKKINDTYGHAAGDIVIAAFAGIARTQLREADILARMGGEEFAILLPDCPPAQAEVIAERLRAAFAATSIEIGNGERVSPTVSIGCISAGIATADVEAMLAAADRALYSAKNSGRDRVSSGVM